MPFTEKDWAPAAGAFLFAAVFALYLATLAPGVTFWDSGELAAAAWSLGIPHQPGYPLFCVMGRLFSLMPVGSVAYRLNLLSAFFCATAVLVVYFALLEVFRAALKGRPGPAEISLAAALALMLGVSRVFWSQAVLTEVYALNGFFVAALVLAHAASASGRLSGERYVALSGFLFGLGVVNHASLVLYLPALLLGWALCARGAPPARAFLSGAFFAILGLSTCIYLPVRSAAGPALNIGHPDTWPWFAWVVKWGAYAGDAKGLIASVSALPGRLDVTDWRLLVGIPAAAAALWLLVRDNYRLYLPQAVFLTVFVVALTALVSGAEREIRFGLPPKFFIPAFIVAAVLAGGLANLAVGRAGREGRGYLPWVAVAVLAAAVPVTAYRNVRPNDMSGNYMAFDYAANSLKSAGEDGVLLTWGDNGVFPLWYLSTVERYRDDAVLVHTPLMTYDWYLSDVEGRLGGRAGFMKPYFLGENAFRLYKAVSPRRPFAFDYSATRFLKLDKGLLAVRGLIYYEGGAPEGDPWPMYVFRGVSDPDVYKGPMEKNIIEIYRYQARLSAAMPAGLFERP